MILQTTMKYQETVAEAYTRAAWLAATQGYESYEVVCPQCGELIEDHIEGCPVEVPS